MTDDLAQALVAFVNTHIMASGHPIRPEDSFEGAGIDSLAMLKVLLFIEKEFGFWIPDEDLVDENIGSARALASYVAGRLPSL